jgi:uncharacterized protein YyaL (SSP411 family)
MNQKHVLAYAHLTLKKMAFGGIYDQIGGGFARYSTDPYWKVPHFEKMLYDNGQLMSLYAEAYLQRADEDYRKICQHTAKFIALELSAVEGYFYSALDADSEGEEGKFYVWKKQELIDCLTADEFRIAEQYYSINPAGYWEHENYILLRRDENALVAERLDITEKELEDQIKQIETKLYYVRSKRIRPGLDDKLLTSWNAMMIRGLADAARVFDDESMLRQGTKAMHFILNELKDPSGRLCHSYKTNSNKISGFLEDYAFVIDALIGLYECTYEAHWLIEARELMFTVLNDFDRSETGLFYFTSNLSPVIVSRQLETSDNVQPASNSVMARNLYTLGIYFGKPEWMEQTDSMLRTVREELIKYGPGYSNWAMLVLDKEGNKKELVITGKNAIDEAKRLRKTYHPSVMIAAAEGSSPLPLFQGRFKEDETWFYLCQGTVCEAPTRTFNWE